MLILADARRLPLRDGCVQCVVTSPPYWGLRDYGDTNQIGLEATPDLFVTHIRCVFSEVRRVLKNDGTVWLNLGDSYASGGTGRRDTSGEYAERRAAQFGSRRGAGNGPREYKQRERPEGLKAKDLIGIPWRVAFALQADGWYLRSDIIWSKPNPMPESVTDRPTKAHEYLFLLSKSQTYYYDADAIKEAAVWTRENNPEWQKQRAETNARKGAGNRNAADGGFTGWKPENGRNKRSVWTVPTMPYAGAHFATFPEKLIEPCILAGCPLGGLVLDPFLGSGTVGAVAERLGRRWVGTDLSYQPLATARTAQRGLRW